MRVSELASRALDLPPSCAEFCPAYPSLLVIGTYHLDDDEPPDANDQPPQPSDDYEPGDATAHDLRPQTRSGSLTVWRIPHNNNSSDVSLLHTLPQPSAVLDLHFHPSPTRHTILATVSSTTTLGLFSLADDGSLCQLADLRVPSLPDHTLLLSLAWHPSHDDTIALATSTGAVLLVHLAWPSPPPPSAITIRTTIELSSLRNDLEAWCVAFTFSPDPLLISGGDDSAIRYTTTTLSSSPPPIRHLHTAGVTALLPLSAPDTIATGSYDGTLRIISLRSPRVLASVDLDGGVWRLRQIPTAPATTTTRVLASCMHAGAYVLDLEYSDDDVWHIVVRARFTAHASMNYASDAQPGGRLRCVSTSFYDRLLCLWEVSDE